LFTHDDYEKICNDPNRVEQVELTKLMKENSVDMIFLGHDHIFNVKEIGEELDGKKLYGICVGSPNISIARKKILDA